ncbi:hypothetical protein CSOJ01_04797 [Colletotrichum sojae]|uniref:Uncharacterized protein n=1 Tax=Colletotrichum sojae TaxID=2175907 RepID=A0A8H6JI53_9PEZI|nr:hypothetical protein CSOJ01_04797 [Colletotrichum sojae]
MSSIAILWLPNLLMELLALLARPLEHVFYRADIGTAYHIFACAFVYFTAWLNAVVKVSPLNDRLEQIADSDVFSRIGAANRLLVKGYLRGCFFVPNLVGPVWMCWYMHPHDAHLDALAHLYGFTIGLLHMPLIFSLVLRGVLPMAFAVPCVVVVEKVSEALWMISDWLPEDPVAAAQKGLRELRRLLRELLRATVKAVDREVLRSEHRVLVAAAWGVVVMQAFILHGMLVDLYRPYLQRLVVRVVSDALICVGDALFDAGMWVEGFLVERVYWDTEGRWVTAFH